MSIIKRIVPFLALAAFVVGLFYFHHTSDQTAWRHVPQVVGLGELVAEPTTAPTALSYEFGQTGSPNLGGWDPTPTFLPGRPKPPGSNYTRTLVVSRVAGDDVSWIYGGLPDIEKKVYVADNSSAALHPPKNKGHEVMIYLTYIIDHYDDLPDVSIFMHAHRWSWHNNDLQHHDAAEMVSMLSSERVQRVGYMNLRCHWFPGCPNWMHPGVVQEKSSRKEETLLAECWSELFPRAPIPHVLATACCAQFAISRDRIRSIPLSTFNHYRNWLLRTELNDFMSGRVWEYLWQYVFTGQSSLCPSQHACYCDGYGICFEGEEGFNHWIEVRDKMELRQKELAAWHEKADAIKEAKNKGRLDEAAKLEVPELGRDTELDREIDQLSRELTLQHDMAVVRGKEPRIRALESGREWNEGDGL